MPWGFRKKREMPTGLWTKCPVCQKMVYAKKVAEARQVCPECGHHGKISAAARIEYTVDEGTFEEFAAEIAPHDHLAFHDNEPYAEKLRRTAAKTGRLDAVVLGRARIQGRDVVLAVLDFTFMGGSMGNVVGEKIALAAETAVEERRPLVVVSSSGGARMHEGALSLMQMAKTCAVLARLREACVPYVSVLADPCTGGVSASFAALGDVLLAEPGALIGFAGPRVIETTIRTKLPEGFQRAEFLLEHGFIDRIVPRAHLPAEIAKCIDYLTARPYRGDGTVAPEVAAGLDAAASANGPPAADAPAPAARPRAPTEGGDGA